MWPAQPEPTPEQLAAELSMIDQISKQFGKK
jgi:hypothetical protein